MKLLDLEPQFIMYSGVVDGHESMTYAPELAQAHGICFLCPKCYAANNGPVGAHSIICWFEDLVPDTLQPGPGRWKPAGAGYHDLSFVVGKNSNSIQLSGGCNWHGFITRGEVHE